MARLAAAASGRGGSRLGGALLLLAVGFGALVSERLCARFPPAVPPTCALAASWIAAPLGCSKRDGA